MATGGTRRNGYVQKCRRIEATGGAECSQLGAETERGGMMAKLEKLYEIIDKENFEPGGTLEERVAVLEEVLQEQVMAVTTAKEDD